MIDDAGVLWLVVLAGGVGTYALRASFVVVVGRVDEIPPRIERALEFVPAAVLAALVVPAVVAVDASGGALVLPTVAYSPKLPAAAIAALVAWKTENVLATIAAGMVALWTLQAI
ncbi:AzlD domain-containing protein [Halorubellus sp. JP-L1]|uniref:AzlD domain-containing protein n=1 Tax=Halorubellus sp. JP-L1 TaxID=2715753 RepID=UPI00140A9435|nr:AzlD domain-containing protein [Halorubellus sp. JP-L1]NHN40182.1 AzlD domain-containing protein [Halorubellus sp. JP-L1]